MSSSHYFDEDAGLFNEEVLEQTFTDLFKLIVLSMIINEKEGELLILVFLILFTIYHGVTKILVNLFS